MKNYYETLGLSPNATSEQIKLAYTNAVLKIQGQPNFAILFAEIQSAYDVLSHLDSKKSFDKELQNYYAGKFTNHNIPTVIRTPPPKEKPQQKVVYTGSIPKSNFRVQKAFGILAMVALVFFITLSIKTCNDGKADSVNNPVAQNTAVSTAPSTNTYNSSPTPVSSNDSTNGNYNGSNSLTYSTSPNKVKPIEDYSDWSSESYNSGETPNCYRFTPSYNYNLDNYLKVVVDNSTDVAIKLINHRTNRCIRYVYIKSGTTIYIRNIPEGVYYSKIAYGEDWRIKNVNGTCVGKFVKHTLFKKGTDLFNFNKTYSGKSVENRIDGNYEVEHYSVPSWELKLGVISTSYYDPDRFNSSNIDEDEFSK